MKNILSVGKDCCGCYSCKQICPKNCINFRGDAEGFMYPYVDENLCIECGKCLRGCPVASPVAISENPTVLGAKLKDGDVCANSTSGGIFYPLASDVINAGGVVFGCAYDENLSAKHIMAETLEDLRLLQGSKYVQSNTDGVYTMVKAQLETGRQVLFSGTGCQVAGLKAFLGNKEYPNLLNVDIVCHGVPSQKLFSRYLEYLGKKSGGKITSYSFRSKEKQGWGLYYKAVSQSGKTKTGYGYFDPYYYSFLTCKTYRESCYNCKFANERRTGDITLADYWGIEKIDPSFYDKKGVSVVIINTDKGNCAWEKIKDKTEFVPSSMELAAQMNGNLSHPSQRPACRDTIYQGLDGDIEAYVNQKLKPGLMLKRRIKMLIPISVKGKIKHMLKK